MTIRNYNSILLIALLTTLALPVSAQIFDSPQNLQVLPGDTDPMTLRDTMRGFALGTGLRCNSCHEETEGKPMAEWDFSSDAKDLKKKARVMLKMVNEINSTHLGRYGEDRVKVQCVTCHRGISKPRQIDEELFLAAEDGGAGAIKSRYFELKEKYYGSHSYDFREFTISQIAHNLGAAGNTDEAAALLDAMLEGNPESISAHFVYSELKRRAGDGAGALAHLRILEKILPESTAAIKPPLELIERRIEEIEGQSTEK